MHLHLLVVFGYDRKEQRNTWHANLWLLKIWLSVLCSTKLDGSSLNLRKEKRSSALKINNCKKTYHDIIKMQNSKVLFSLYHQGLEQIFIFL